MADDKTLLYRIEIQENGTMVLHSVGAAGKKMGEDVTAGASAATAALNKQAAATERLTAATQKMTVQQEANAAYWMGPAAKIDASLKEQGKSYATMSAQQKANADYWITAEGLKAQAAIKTTGEIKKQGVEASSLSRTMERIQRTIAAFAAVYAFQKIASGLSQMIALGIEYNATLEQSKLGMGAIFTAQGQFVNSSGKALAGTEALNAAMKMSSDIAKKLQLDNLQTAATYQQLVKAYQQTVAPGLAVGFDPDQIRKYTLAMVQAASAMGLNLDMLAEETRSMLRGTITPRNTLIATALGLRNEDIRKYKNDTEGLYAFIMGKLSAFGVAGDLAQKTWAGVTSNIKDAIGMVLGESFKPMFEYLKSEMTNIQNNLVKWTTEGPKINEDVVAGFSEVNDLLVNILKLSKEIALAFTPLQSALSPVATTLNFVMEKMTKMISVYYEYKRITDELLSRIGSKIKSDFVEKGVPKGLGGSVDMPFGDMSYGLKYTANKIGPGKEEAEIAEKIAKINLQIASQNKNYGEQISLVNILTQAEIEKAAAEGKSNVELENALKRQGEQRKKQILIQKDMERLGWVGEVLAAEAAIAGMNGNLQTQIQLERESLNITLLKNRSGLGARDVTQIEVENYSRMRFDLEAMQKLNMDRLAKESAIISAQTSIADLTGDYEQQAFLMQEAYLNRAEELKATQKLNTEEEKRVDILNSIAIGYKSNQLILEGEYSVKNQILDLENQSATISGSSSNILSTQLDLLEAQVVQMQLLLDAKIKLGKDTGKPISPEIIEKDQKAIDLTEQIGLDAWTKSYDDLLSQTADFYSTLMGFEEEYRSSKMDWIDAEQERLAAFYDDDVAAAQWAAQEKGKFEQELFEKKSKLISTAVGDMASAFTSIGNMYDKNSAEYNRMQEAAKAMIVLQQAVAVANAVAAIANQGLGDPYTAIARIAAMTAAMGSLLASTGLSLGGGGGAISAPVLPPSTVLGAAPGTGSESISKSYELLQDTYSMEYRELTGINDSMRELNQNITGLVTSIVRTGGVGAFTSAPGSTMGWEQQLQTNIDKPFLSLMSGDPIGKAIAGFISKWGGKLVGSIFGGGSSSSVASAGISLGGTSVGGLLAGRGMGAQQYADITTQHEGGWFHDDWTSGETQSKALDAQVTDMLNATFKSIGSTLVELAMGLGTNMQAAYAYVFAATKINLQGMDTEAINKALSDFISGTADKAVESLFGPMLRGYQQLDEGLLQTAVRLLRDKTVIMDTLAMTGQAFTGTIPQIIAFSESIISMAGDLDTFTKAASTYYDKFFSDTEKQLRLQTQLSDALGGLPIDRAGYRAEVEKLHLENVEDQKRYVLLMQLSYAADQYYSVVEDATGATDKLTESLRNQVKAITEWLADLSLSNLAPVTSKEAFSAEYGRQKAMAYAPGATDQDLSGFLNYSKEYLQFMRTYGGDYKAIYDAVVGDVQQLGDIKDAQVAAIEAADAAARIAANAQLEMLSIVAMQGVQVTHPVPYVRETIQDIIDRGTLPPMEDRAIPNPSPRGSGRYIPEYASGGLMIGPSIGGEQGTEWAVPTYEPQRSRFLGSAPPQFWENLRGAGGAQSGGGGDITIRVPVVIDGKMIGEVVAKQIPRNGDLSGAIASVRKAS